MIGPFVIRALVSTSLLLALFVFAFVFAPETAHAFCRESVMSAPSGPCDEAPGVPLLHWTRDCVTYVFNDQMFSRMAPLTEAQVRATFNTAFQTWADVDCGDMRSPFFVEQSASVTATSKAEFIYDEPNESVIVARTRTEWSSLPNHDPTALAFTLLWHDKNTGEILDVDMELNTGAGTFADCVATRCASTGRMVDLANTVTHEAGHLLGLGHTTVRGATMTTTAVGAETEKRSLETDDKDGYCSLDLPEFECSTDKCMCAAAPIFRSKTQTKSCSCRAAGSTPRDAQSSPLRFAPLAFIAGAAFLRVRTRRRFNRAVKSAA